MTIESTRKYKGNLVTLVEEALATHDPATIRQAISEIIAAMRPMDQRGAMLLTRLDKELDTLIMRDTADIGPQARTITRKLEELARAEKCLECGTCCRASSPTLSIDDLEMVESGAIRRADLFVLRPGERAYSPRERTTRILEEELIKLKERLGGGCMHLMEPGCAIYESRPAQCRDMECWSKEEKEPGKRLARKDLFAGDENALGLAAEFDQKVPATELDQALSLAAKGQEEAAKKAMALMELDHRLRLAVEEKYGYSASELELLFGRPALIICASYGLEPALDSQGNPYLAAVNSKSQAGPGQALN